MSVMPCLQMHGINWCWEGLYGVFGGGGGGRKLIVKEHSKLGERKYITIILKRRKFEVNIDHCPEEWCSFEFEIEYSICTAFRAFIQ